MISKPEVGSVGVRRGGEKYTGLCGALVTWRDGRPDAPIPLEREEILLGRVAEADIRLNSPFTSRRHAKIIAGRDAFSGELTHLIRDLGSRHGTLLNGSRVKEAFLRHGDDLVIGFHFLRFIYVELTECD